MIKSTYKKVFYLIIITFLLFPFGSLSLLLVNNGNNSDFYNNFVAAKDDPDIDLSDLPQIDYNSVITDWYNPKIEMLIIVPPDLTPSNLDWVEAVQPLADWKNEKGVKTIILNSTLWFTQGDLAERIKNTIKYYYETNNIRWVLLCGDAQDDLIPIRYVYNDDTPQVSTANEHPGWDEYYKPTDYYYSDLTGTWYNPITSRWGESARNSGSVDMIDWTPEVYVGRFPADTVEQLEIMVNKTLKYESDPEVGGWMDKMLLAGGVSDLPNTGDPIDVDGEDEARLTSYIWQQYTQYEMNFDHLVNFNAAYYTPPGTYSDLNQNSYNNSITLGHSTIIFAGHGDKNLYNDKIDSPIYDSTEAEKINNKNMLSLIYADACTTSAYDQPSLYSGPIDDINIGEILIKRPEAGAIGYVGGIRVTWYFSGDFDLEKLNRGCAKLFWQEFFQEKKFQQGRALYDSKVSYMNSDYFKRGAASMEQEWQRKNILTYNLLGDPEVDIYTNIPDNASNPFAGTIYGAQWISTIIRDEDRNAVPYARVHFRTDDGVYHTEYADKNGFIYFHLPSYSAKTYNVTITGHNLIPSYFNFTTLLDNIKPEVDDEECIPEEPTVSDKICFQAESYDLQSGLESIYLIESENDDFKRYDYYKMFNSLQDDDDDLYEYTMNKLDPGTYYFAIIARDWANNYIILTDDELEITIQPSPMNVILIITSISIIGVIGLSVVVGYFEYKKYIFIQWKLKRQSET